MEKPAPGEVYHHFKDSEKRYEIVGIAFHTETKEDMVVYKPLYENPFAPLFVRPLSMFMERVEKPDMGYAGPRFMLVKNG